MVKRLLRGLWKPRVTTTASISRYKWPLVRDKLRVTKQVRAPLLQQLLQLVKSQAWPSTWPPVGLTLEPNRAGPSVIVRQFDA